MSITPEEMAERVKAFVNQCIKDGIMVTVQAVNVEHQFCSQTGLPPWVVFKPLSDGLAEICFSRSDPESTRNISATLTALAALREYAESMVTRCEATYSALAEVVKVAGGEVTIHTTDPESEVKH